MTTDAPLLFFWSAGLYACALIFTDENPRSFIFAALGAAVGFGFLSKYAMLYFVIAFVLSLAAFPTFRNAFLRKELALTVAVAVVLIAPNIAWNAAHDFQTVAHTAANANWGANLFKPMNLLSFFGDQFAVAGPLFFAGLLWCAARQISNGEAKRAPVGALYLFALTPLVIVSAQAFISRAHANWAAAAYPAAIILVTAWLYQHRAAWLARAGVIAQAAFAAVFIIAIAQFSLIDRFGFSSSVSSLRGWKEQTGQIAAMADGYDAVALDDRDIMGAMLYYQRDKGLEIVAIDPNAHISHHYEAFKAFDPAKQKRVLFVTLRDDAAHVDYRFREITLLGAASVDLGGKTRVYHLFDISEYYGRDAPQRED